MREENARDESHQIKGAEPERQPVKANGRKTPASFRGIDFLRSGVPMTDIPPEQLREIASRIGNNAFLGLISHRQEIEIASSIPSVSPAGFSETASDIKTDAPALTDSSGLVGSALYTEPFPVSRIADRSGTNTDMNIIGMRAGAANGSVSD